MADITATYGFLRRHAAELVAFAAVARAGSVSAAAPHLGLSQPGLSQRIRHLEAAVGLALFARSARGVVLTPAGATLFARIEPHLGAIAGALADARRQARAPEVLIAVDYAFAAFWILPRLAALGEAVRPVPISVLAAQNPAASLPAGPDIVVRMGAPDPAGGETRLIGERVSAVASPGFVARHPGAAAPADLARMPLLGLSGAGGWFDWESWFAHFGAGAPAGLRMTRFNTYDLVVQAAVAGHGVALGWHGLIDGKLKEGALVPVLPHVAESPRGYFIALARVPAGAAARRAHDWIVAEAAGEAGACAGAPAGEPCGGAAESLPEAPE
ncbi:LysR family transcriptional regulator [Albidovulum sp.]|uniref:LysR family transcriptional regulator n=1 Tax=Albidovulum sp. TaxID=1872424 RepID=UPI0039B9521A